MEEWNRKNLIRATIVDDMVEREYVKGYLISNNTFIAFPESEEDYFRRYYVPNNEQEMEKLTEKHIPYVKSYQQCKLLDRTFDGLKAMLKDYKMRNIHENGTLSQIMNIPSGEEFIYVTYCDRSAIALEDDWYLKTQASQLRTDACLSSYLTDVEVVSHSLSLLKTSDDKTEVIPLKQNDKAVYLPYYAYDLSKVNEDVVITKMVRYNWSTMSDYDIHNFIVLYFQYLNAEKNKASQKMKVRNLN